MSKVFFDPVLGALRTTDSGGGTIGGLVTGGTPGSVLFVDASGDLGQDNANFFWDDTTKALSVGNPLGVTQESTYAFDAEVIYTANLGNVDYNAGVFGAQLNLSVNTNGGTYGFVSVGQSTSGNIHDIGFLEGGIQYGIHRGDGHVDNLVGFEAGVINNGGGVVDEATCMWASFDGNNGAGSISNLYGLKIAAMTAGNNNWAIKTDQGKIEFGDSSTANGFFSIFEPDLADGIGLLVQENFNSSPGSIEGLDVTVNADGFVDASAELHAMVMNAQVGNTSVARVGKAYGVEGFTGVGASSTIDDGQAVIASLSLNTTGTITDMSFFHALHYSPGVGTITNLYGLRIDDLASSASNAWAIKTGTGNVQLGTLSGSGTRMVTATSTGVLGTTTLPISTLTAVSATAQIADITDTALGTTGNGLYRVSYYLLDTTADLTAGAVTLNIKFTDNAAARTISSAPVALTTLAGFTQGVVIARLNSGSLTYGVTHTGIFGSATYALYLSLERLI